MHTVTVKAPAKINLALDIVGLNEKNYHLLKMLMQTVDLYDTVTLQKQPSGITLTCDNPSLPCDERNICHRCAQAFFTHIGQPETGVQMHIQKVIPQQAGMAGGSADGAGVLVGLNALYDAKLSLETLCAIGARIGADIPFCLVGGTAKVEGIGERITPIPALPDCELVIAKPSIGVSTQRAFAEFDRLRIPPQLDLDAMVRAVECQDLSGVCAAMYNALERVCGVPEVRSIRHLMMSMGAKGAMMTGSGSAVFGIFSDRGRAYECEQKLRTRYAEVFLCKPAAHGPQIVTAE